MWLGGFERRDGGCTIEVPRAVIATPHPLPFTKAGLSMDLLKDAALQWPLVVVFGAIGAVWLVVGVPLFLVWQVRTGRLAVYLRLFRC